MKKAMAMMLALLLIMLAPNVACATGSTTPVFNDGDNPKFYANGTPITIEENAAGGAIIKYSDKSIEVPENTTVFGGGVAGTDFDSSSITMNGGTIYAIYGGGEGTGTTEAKVGTATIKVTNGTIKPNSSGNRGFIAGGGVLYASVENANIEITGGTVFTVMGGGMAYSDGVAAGTKANPENSKNRTTNVKIVISGGTINAASKGYGLVYGGGQSYSYVGKTDITISKTADLSKAWVVGGGSNGRTDYSTINVNGGTIKVIQTINRGSMIDAKVNVTAGTVTTLYVGGEDPEDFSNDIVNGGFIGNIIIDITGGTVTSLQPGSNYDKAIAKDSMLAKVFYVKESVTNNTELDALLGTIAKPYAEANTVVEKTTEDTTITTDLLTALKETNNSYTISVNDKYEWVFKGENIVNPEITVDTTITLTEEAPVTIKEEVEAKIEELELTDVIFLNFAHDGDLPGKATIVYDVAGTFDDGTVLYILHYNETLGKLGNEQQVTVTDGKITFEIESCSSYVVSRTAAKNIHGDQPINNPSTGDINVTLLIMIIVISLGSLTFVIKKAYSLMK